MDLVCFILGVAFYVLIIWIVLGWIVAFGRLPWGHPIRKIYDTLASVIEPVLRPIRNLLPPLRMGGMGLDLSPLILFFGLSILQRIIC